MSKKIIIPLVAIILIAVAGIAFLQFNGRKKEAPRVLESVTVQLMWLNQAQFAGMYAAKEKNFYADAGLDVKLEEFNFNRPNIAADVENGEAQFGLSAAVEALAEIGRGRKIKIIGAIYQQSPFAYVSLAESMIKSPADWKGKTVSNLSGANLQDIITMNYLLQKFGIGADDVKRKDVGFEQAKALLAEEVDVASLYRTNEVFDLEEKGVAYNLIAPETYEFNTYGDVVIASESLIKNNPDLVRRFMQATVKGWEYALNHQDEAVDITLKYANKIYQGRAQQKFVLEKSAPLIKSAGSQKIGAMNFVYWNNLYNEMKKNNLLQNKFYIGDAYTAEFLK